MRWSFEKQDEFMSDNLSDEFKVEAMELLDDAEDALMEMEKGADFGQLFNKVFRAFHSIKGGAGMFQMTDLQNHVHQLETLFDSLKKNNKINTAQADYFLIGIDGIKKIFADERINFKHLSLEDFNLVDSSIIASSVPVVHTQVVSKGELIYVVDDEPEIVEILEMQLIKNKYRVRTFLNANDLLLQLEKESPICILADINMPKMSGLQMVEKIREMDFEIPVIFISAYVTKEVLLKGLEDGRCSYIEKPFKEANVFSTLQFVIKRYKAALLIKKMINLLIYQFSDLEKFLINNNKTSIVENMKQEFQTILKLRDEIK